MSQVAYDFDPAAAYAGMPVDGNLLKDVRSGIALEKLDFGKAAIRVDITGKASSVRAPKRNQSVNVFSADLVTSNSVAALVNGIALTATVFSGDHATTMAAIGAKIVAELLAQDIVAEATVGGANDRTLTITAEDANILISGVIVTLGGSQATVTTTNGTADTLAKLKGLLRFSSQPPRTSDGLNGFEALDSVPVVRQGSLWCPISSDVAEGADVYIDYTAGNEGMLTDVTTAPNLGPIVGAKFAAAGTVSGLGLAPVDINLP